MHHNPTGQYSTRDLFVRCEFGLLPCLLPFRSIELGSNLRRRSGGAANYSMSTFLRRIRRTWFVLLILVLVPVICGAQAIVPVIEVQNPPNSPAQQAKHYVVLVSLDGFRYDYAKKYGAKNLLAMARRGASAPEE